MTMQGMITFEYAGSHVVFDPAAKIMRSPFIPNSDRSDRIVIVAPITMRMALGRPNRPTVIDSSRPITMPRRPKTVIGRKNRSLWGDSARPNAIRIVILAPITADHYDHCLSRVSRRSARKLPHD